MVDAILHVLPPRSVTDQGEQVDSQGCWDNKE